MMSEYDFVIFLSGDWDIFFRRYLLRVLAEQLPMSKVVCVDRPVCLVTTPLRDPARWIKQVAGWDRLRKLGENLFVYRPWVFLHDHVAAKLPVVQVSNMMWVRRQVLSVMASLGLQKEHLITWVFDPFQEEYMGLLRERFSIYECYDEYASWDEVRFWRTRDEIRARENRILGKADITFVVSEALYESKCQSSRNIHVVPNGVDFDHYFKANLTETKIPENIANIKKPIIGYVGSLGLTIDFESIKYMAEAKPEWSIVLVGPWEWNSKKYKTISECKRVYLLGKKGVNELPGYLKAMDVAIMPYRRNEEIKNANPVKLLEYMAGGRPFVSTGIPYLHQFSSVARIAKTRDEFVRLVSEALSKDNRNRINTGIEIARSNTWDDRIDLISRIILENISPLHQ